MIREIVENLGNVKLKDIQSLVKSEPTFLFVMGSTGSGKNYIVSKNFKGVELADIDKYMAELAAGGGDERKFISKAIAIANKVLTKSFENDKSVIQVGTGGNIKGLENKIIKAKSYGFKTALILVDASIKKSMERNQARADQGDQRLVPDWKVEKSYYASKDNFEILKSQVDLATIIKN